MTLTADSKKRVVLCFPARRQATCLRARKKGPRTYFTPLCEDEPYRGAMLSTDLAIADSGLRAAEDIHFCSQ